jgi:hypothetical protein
MNFSRSKKEKTSEKRDASEEKKNSDADLPGTNEIDLVRKFSFFGPVSIFYVKKSGYKPTNDQDFQMYFDEIRPHISKVPLSEQISNLGR